MLPYTKRSKYENLSKECVQNMVSYIQIAGKNIKKKSDANFIEFLGSKKILGTFCTYLKISDCFSPHLIDLLINFVFISFMNFLAELAT